MAGRVGGGLAARSIPRPAVADRNLLFGLLALQNGLIDQVQLVAAFQAWTLDKARTLADHLVGRGDLDADGRSPSMPWWLATSRSTAATWNGVSPPSRPAAPPARASPSSAMPTSAPPSPSSARARPARCGGRRPHRQLLGRLGHQRRPAVPRAAAARPRRAGAVFVALDTELHREVALKQILDHHADDPTSRQRFLIEAEITGGLEHPGIVPVYGLGTYGDGRPYYAMRFIRGDSLKEAMEHFHADAALKTDPGRRSLELRKLLLRFLDVCNAIDYAHSRGCCTGTSSRPT